MSTKLEKLMLSTQDSGFIKGNTLHLEPDVALRLADDLEKIEVPIVAVELWYQIPYQGSLALVEDPYGPSFEEELKSENPAHDTVVAAKRYLQNELPERIKYVSFVLETDERYWEAYRVAKSSVN